MTTYTETVLTVGLALLQLQNAELKALAANDSLKLEEAAAPFSWHGDGYWVHGSKAPVDLLKKYEEVFVREWKLYPKSLVEKAQVHRIVFAGDLSVDGQSRAAVPAFDGDTMYYDPVLGAKNLHYQRVVIHHEFFHMIDERMGFLREDSEWSRLNPPGFKYGSGGDKMRTNGVGELTDKIGGFLTLYSVSGVEEDKAELFAHMIVDGPYVAERMKADPYLTRKVQLLKIRLAAFDADLGEDWWRLVVGFPGRP